MKPDAAAEQLQLVDPNIASAIIMKLAPRQSALILAEMEEDKAATLTSIISAAVNRKPSRKNPT
jgi:flagellar motility protein MotE (MotC chaperone)